MGEVQHRYRAFISYSQKDKNFAKRLHKALESYRLPSGIDTKTNTSQKRSLGRFFRDDEEMGAAADLGQALRGAIEDSEGLIVICSPHSARSIWVNEEILHFKRTGRADKIFAVIVDGEPNISNSISAETASNECFPPALRYQLGKDGQICDLPAEPLGLDIRKDSFSRLKVRLAAGLLNYPFDTLWQRERLRKQKQATIAFGTITIILISFGLLGRFWWAEREKVAKQEFEQVKALAINDIAEDRELQGLARIKPYLSGNFEKAAVPVLQDTLSWVQSASEQFNTITLPRLIRFHGNLIYVSKDERFYDLSDLGTKIKRVLLSHDEKRIVVIGDYKTVVLKRASGERLSEIRNGRISWDSLAFERPDSSLIVLGTHSGSTNGTISHQALVVSPDGHSLSASVISPFVAFKRLWITPNCTEFVVESGDAVFALRYDGVNLKEHSVKTKIQNLPNFQIIVEKDNEWGNNPFGSDANSTLGRQSLTNAGCRPVESDSDLKTKATKSLLPTQFSKYKNNYSAALQLAPNQITSLYREVVNLKFDELDEQVLTFYGELSAYDRLRGRQFWRTPPVPKGIALHRTEFDVLEGKKLAFHEDHANAGMTWSFCHFQNSETSCNRISVLHNEERSYEVVRSPKGRYVLLAQAGLIFDLKTLQKSTEVQEIPTLPGSAFDFEPDGMGLSIAVQGELIFFHPNKVGKWKRNEEVAPVSLPKQTNTQQTTRYAGLIAIGDGSYILAYVDGTVVRINRKGHLNWRFNATGIGPVELLSYSEDRSLFVLAGRNGYRIYRTKNRLPISGILEWPKLPGADKRAESQVDNWLNNLHVSNDGSINFIIYEGWREEEKPFSISWKQKIFKGNIQDRVEHLLCENSVGSPIEKLQYCYKKTR